MAVSKLMKAVAAIKRPFMAFSSDFGKLAESRAELAPKFARAFGLFQAEGEGGSLADFARLLDPSVPTERDAYRVHKSYMAADYLRRLRRTDKGSNRAKPVRSNLSAMGRLLATIQALTAEPDKLWKGIQDEFGMTARQVTKLRQVVSISQPIIRIPNVKPVRVSIVHVDPAEAQAALATARQVNRAA